jgi:starch phosphorylase
VVIDMINLKRDFKKLYLEKLSTITAKDVHEASNNDKYLALGELIREIITDRWIDTNNIYLEKKGKQVYYFSMEFLLGRLLNNNIMNLELEDIIYKDLKELDVDIDKIILQEHDQGLGNGGLGRLAACFLDSAAMQDIPVHGCGIRYNYGLFEQRIIDGYQVEFPDKWLSNKNVWEVAKREKAIEIRFGGTINTNYVNGAFAFEHQNYERVLAVPYDTPVVGKNVINTLRLWSAESVQEEFDYLSFSQGNYSRAFEKKHTAEAISHVLYPNDNYYEGKILRLKQEYFFVSAGLQSILKTYKKSGKSIFDFHKHISIHINDTHPALCIPELMRLLLDEESMDWDTAWHITKKTMSYTNHTILSEALERWNQSLFKELLPRIYMIIDEINKRFYNTLLDKDCWERLAIIYDNEIRMANLCIIGSSSVNGVAKLHTEILKQKELKHFYNIYPYKFNNKTNGITHRRWLEYSNPSLTSLITESIGDKWKKDPILMKNLMQFSSDKGFLDKLDIIKTDNKIGLSKHIKEKYGIDVNPRSIFDVQAKRIHEYKRQILNIMQVIDMYFSLKDHPNMEIPEKTFIFAGKSAPGYEIAKQTIKLINTVAQMVNNDKTIRGKIKIVYLENYSVSLAQILIPSADLSEQISTATKEASGTGNMKFMMNGALTIATLDGANIEIKDAVGDDNIFIFGLRDDDVYRLYRERTYRSIEYYNSDDRIKRVLDYMNKPEFSLIVDSLLKYNDEYFVLKDFNDYVKAQKKSSRIYMDKYAWLNKSLVNISSSGIFSSDYTIREYANDVWKLSKDIVV